MTSRNQPGEVDERYGLVSTVDRQVKMVTIKARPLSERIGCGTSAP